MRERGILFSAPMVRAIIAGTKTQTRRVAKVNDHDCKPGFITPNAGFVPRRVQDHAVYCPYGQPGDRLWVRETWRADHLYDDVAPSLLPKSTVIRFEADKAQWTEHQFSRVGKARPSMFMPRWASRLTLEITEVCVERLNEIGEEDARAEGIGSSIELPKSRRSYSPFGPCVNCGQKREQHVGPLVCFGRTTMYSDDTARGGFERLWESINGPGSWAANPYVWAITFKRLP